MTKKSIKKRSRKARSKRAVSVKVVRPRIAEEIGDWMYHRGRGGRVFSDEEIAKQIKLFRIRHKLNQANDAVRRKDVVAFIPRMRMYLEVEHKVTVVRERGRGYKIASPQEAAVFAMQTARTTTRWVERSVRLIDIVDVKYLPRAYNKVFGALETTNRTYVRRTRRFIETCVSEAARRRRELAQKKREERKALEDKRRVKTK